MRSCPDQIHAIVLGSLAPATCPRPRRAPAQAGRPDRWRVSRAAQELSAPGRALIQNLVNKPVLMENAAEMETKPEQELSAKQKALGEVGRTRISTLQFR